MSDQEKNCRTELTTRELDLVSGGAHAELDVGPLHIWASDGHGFGISLSGVGYVTFGVNGASVGLNGVGSAP